MPTDNSTDSTTGGITANPRPCPTCGTCPTCGARMGIPPVTIPTYPHTWPFTTPTKWWEVPPVTCRADDGSGWSTS